MNAPSLSRVIVHMYADEFKFNPKVAHNKKKGNRDTVRFVEIFVDILFFDLLTI